MTNPYRQDAAAVLAAHASTPAGLTPAEAGARLAADGPNELRETVSRPAWRMLLAQFIEPMILILLAAAGFAVLLAALYSIMMAVKHHVLQPVANIAEAASQTFR